MHFGLMQDRSRGNGYIYSLLLDINHFCHYINTNSVDIVNCSTEMLKITSSLKKPDPPIFFLLQYSSISTSSTDDPMHRMYLIPIG